MDASRFLRCLAVDYGKLRDAVTSVEPATPVPSCPGWTVADLARHVGTVYLHKTMAMRLGEFPRPWPPESLAAEPPVALLGRAYAALMTEFEARPPGAPAPTWYEPDQTAGFWIRRMAQETVIHRMDAELAAALPVTTVPDDLATDGVDEVLNRFLAYGTATDPEEYAAETAGLEPAGGPGTIAVEAGTIAVEAGPAAATAGPTAWTVCPGPREVTVEPGRRPGSRAAVQAAPDPLLRWLWGRAPDAAVTFTGDPAWAAYLRRLLVITTQ